MIILLREYKRKVKVNWDVQETKKRSELWNVDIDVFKERERVIVCVMCVREKEKGRDEGDDNTIWLELGICIKSKSYDWNIVLAQIIPFY